MTGLDPASQTLPCVLAGRCGGCPWHERSLVAQRDSKTESLRALFGSLLDDRVQWHGMTTPSALRFRQRLDLRLDQGRLGLLGLGELASTVVDMEACAIATDEVNALLAGLRADLPPVERASIRLRARNGLKGVWLDLPHIAIKALLDEAAWLSRRLADGWVIELGPKGRAVVLDPGLEGPKLRDGPLLPWSESAITGVTTGPPPVALYTKVMGFTQPGALPNAALVAAVVSAVNEPGDVQAVLELGAGAGNLTLPLANAGHRVVALELDVASLVATLDGARSAHPDLVARITPRAGSFHRDAEVPELLSSPGGGISRLDALVCDPPRSGLGRFIDGSDKGGGIKGLSPRLRPRHIVYVSCHPEALATDAHKLATLGYQLASVRGVDQFPWTPHAEWVARFTAP